MSTLEVLPFSAITLKAAPGAGHYRVFDKISMNFLKLSTSNGTQLCPPPPLPKLILLPKPPGPPATSPLPEVLGQKSWCLHDPASQQNRIAKSPGFETCHNQVESSALPHTNYDLKTSYVTFLSHHIPLQNRNNGHVPCRDVIWFKHGAMCKMLSAALGTERCSLDGTCYCC